MKMLRLPGNACCTDMPYCEATHALANTHKCSEIIKQRYSGSLGVFFQQENGKAEKVTHMLVRGKQKMPTMVDVSHLFLFVSTLDCS